MFLLNPVNVLCHRKDQLLSVFYLLDSMLLCEWPKLSLIVKTYNGNPLCVFRSYNICIFRQRSNMNYLSLFDCYLSTRALMRFLNFFPLQLWMLAFPASSGQGDCDTVVKINTDGEEKSCCFHVSWQFHLHLSIELSENFISTVLDSIFFVFVFDTLMHLLIKSVFLKFFV